MTIEEIVTAKEGENFEFKTAEKLREAMSKGLDEITDALNI